MSDSRRRVYSGRIIDLDVEAYKRRMQRRIVQNPKAEHWFDFGLDPQARWYVESQMGIDPFTQDEREIDRIRKWVKSNRPDLVRKQQTFYHPGWSPR